MITFTKEQLIASAHARIEFAEMMLAGELEPLKERTWSIELELARIALASLEAEPSIHRWRRVTSEPYGPYPWHYGDFIGFSKPVDGIEDEYFYSAPPEPANAEPVAWVWSHRKHPSEVTLVRPEDDERAEGANWSGWSCQALYAAQPAPVSVPDEYVAAVPTPTNLGYEAGWNACRAAMLQGVEPVTTDYKLSDGWVACSERMPEIGIKVLCFPVNDEPIHATYNGQVWLQDISWSVSDEPIDNVISCNVFHWMPLPAAPQQEVK